MSLSLPNNESGLKKKIGIISDRQTWQKILTFLLFLLLAFGFWLLQYLQQRFEIDLQIPVHYKNIPKNITLSDSVPEQLFLRIQDKGTVLANYYLGKKYNPVEIDLRKASPEKNSYAIPKSILEKEIYKRLLSSTALVSYFPESLTVDYFALLKKEVPILFDGNIKPAFGYMVDSVILNPDTVSVWGSNVKVQAIHSVNTEDLDLEGVNKNIRKRIRVQADSGIRVSPEYVELTVTAQEYTEKGFYIPVICPDVPSGYEVRLFPSRVEVISQIALTKYSDIHPQDFEVVIKYQDLVNNKDSLAAVAVVKKPEWVKNFRISPEKIEFLIEKKSNP